MTNFSNRTIELKLVNDYHRDTFWGTAHGTIVHDHIKKLLNDSCNSTISIDFHGVKEFDISFGRTIFIDLPSSLEPLVSRSKTVFAKNLENELLRNRLSTLLERNGRTLVVQSGNNFTVTGAVSYSSKVIFHKLMHYSPIDPQIVSRELGGEVDSYKTEFDKFVALGVAKKNSKGLYFPTIHQGNFLVQIRSLIKTFKMIFTRTPLNRLFTKLSTQ